MANVGNVRIGVGVDEDGNLQSQLTHIENQIQSAVSSSKRDTKRQLEDLTRSMANVGTAMSKAITAPIVGAGAAAVKMASDYRDAMAKVYTISDSSVISDSQLAQDILDLSTQTGKAASELADAAYQALSASVETKDVVGFVEQASNLAKAGFLSTKDAVDVLTTVINAYGMSAEDTDMIVGRLIQTQNKGKTTVNELAGSLGQVIPTASAYNVSLDNLMSSYVIMTKQGINAANATTMLNGMMTELSDQGSTVAQILRDKTGKSFGELMAEGADLGDLLGVLYDSVGGNSEQFANLWGNVRAARGALALAKEGADGFDIVMAQMADSGSLVGDALEKLDTPSVRVNKALNALKNTAIVFGEEILSAVAPSLEELAEKAQDLYEWFASLDDETKRLILGVAGFAAAIGPALVATSKLVTTVSKLGKIAKAAEGAGALGKALGLLAKASIPALVASLGVLAGVGIYETIKKTKRLEEVGHTLRDALGKQAEAAEEAGGAFGFLSGHYDETRRSAEKAKGAVDDMVKRQDKMAQDFSQRNTDVAKGTALLQSYWETIDKLNGVADDTNIGELTLAVEGLNEQLGTNYQIMQDEAGNYYVALEDGARAAKEEIYKLIEAQESQMRLDMYRSDYEDALKEQVQLEKDLADATATRDEAMRKAAESKAAYEEAPSNATYQQMLADADAAKDAQEAIESLAAGMGDATAAADYAKQSYEFVAKAFSDSGTATEKYIATNDTLMQMFTATGKSAEDFASDMDYIGLSVEEMAQLSDEQLRQLVSSWDGHAATMKGIMSQFAKETPSLGAWAAEGMAAGIEAKISRVRDAAVNLVRTALNAAKAEAEQGSPWRTTIEMGEFGAEGLAVGFEKGTSEAVSAAQGAIQQILSSIQIEDALQNINWSGARSALSLPNQSKAVPERNQTVNSGDVFNIAELNIYPKSGEDFAANLLRVAYLGAM